MIDGKYAAEDGCSLTASVDGVTGAVRDLSPSATLQLLSPRSGCIYTDGRRVLPGPAARPTDKNSKLGAGGSVTASAWRAGMRRANRRSSSQIGCVRRRTEWINRSRASLLQCQWSLLDDHPLRARPVPAVAQLALSINNRARACEPRSGAVRLAPGWSDRQSIL